MSLIVNVIVSVGDGGPVPYVLVGRIESVLPVNENPEDHQGQLDHVDLTLAVLERITTEAAQEAAQQTSQLRELLERSGG